MTQKRSVVRLLLPPETSTWLTARSPQPASSPVDPRKPFLESSMNFGIPRGQQLPPPTKKAFTFLSPISNAKRVILNAESNRTVPSTEGYFTDSGEYGSILKKRNSTNGSAADEPLRRSERGRRKVIFKNSVSVYRYDSDAESASSPIEHEQFSTEPHDGQIFPDRYGTVSLRTTGSIPPWRWQTDDNESRDKPFRATGSVEARSETSVYRNRHDWTSETPFLAQQYSVRATALPQLISDRGSDSRQQYHIVRVGAGDAVRSPRFYFVNDPVTFRKKLLLDVQLCPDLSPNDVIVKANKSGNKIRIVIAKDAVLGRTSDSDDQILLPARVDPYLLVARLDRDSLLHVEAPVMQ